MITYLRSPRMTSETVFQILLSLNLGFAARMAMAYANYFGREEHLKVWVNQTFHFHPHSELGGGVAFLIVSLEIASILFLLLIVASRFNSFRPPLEMAGGILTFVALPFCYIYRTHLYPPVIGEPNVPYSLLMIELLIISFMALFYTLSTFRLPKWLMAGSILVHFFFWGWLFLGTVYFWRASLHLLFPTVALLSALTWEFSVKKPQTRTSHPV